MGFSGLKYKAALDFSVITPLQWVAFPTGEHGFIPCDGALLSPWYFALKTPGL